MELTHRFLFQGWKLNNERIMETRATHDVRYDNINSKNMETGYM